MYMIQTCWRRTVCQNLLRVASSQGISALAAQGGVATLRSQSVATFSVLFFLLTENEAPQHELLSIESIEVHPFIHEGVCNSPTYWNLSK